MTPHHAVADGGSGAFTAVVLAGDRGPGDPLAVAAGVPSKALVPVGGVPTVLRVLQALSEAAEVEAAVLCCPASLLGAEPRLGEAVRAGRDAWAESRGSPSASAFHALEGLAPEVRVLLTTADHALLTPAMVDFFCRGARASGCDVVVGVARAEMVRAAFPGTRRTVTRLRDGGFCGCNLFAFLTPRSREAARFWQRVERQRKKPLRVVSAVGWGAVARYLLGRLTLEAALRGISRRLGLRAGAVEMPFPEAAVDVDTVGDWRLAEEIAARSRGRGREGQGGRR